MPDKLPKDMTMAERRAEYAKQKNPPTTDREASRLRRVVWLYREMPRIKPARVLDIGCESGFITRWMVDEPYVKELTGIDPCEFSIEHARRMVQKRENPAKANYNTLGWEEMIGLDYDAVVCFEVIEHFLPEEGKQLIAKINSVLRKGGTAFLCTPAAEGRYGNNNPDKFHLKVYEREELAQLVHEITDAKPEAKTGDPNFIMLKWRKV